MSTPGSRAAAAGRAVLVVTVVHHPDDARIRARQIPALLAAGWQVTYAAPWSGYGLEVPAAQGGLTCVDLPRARGRQRLRAAAAARSLLVREAPEHDLVLLHDPELLPLTAGLRRSLVVWDVHEDLAGAMEVKHWIPPLLRRPASRGVRAMERLVERRMPLLLADHRYADRFRRDHPVVPNTTWVPTDPGPAAVPTTEGRFRVVYLGSLTVERGATELVEVARALHAAAPDRFSVQVVGPAHGRAEAMVRAAHDHGDLEWFGYLPNDQALPLLRGALAGLSLLHDLPNFRPSLPTKVGEYLAHGIPVVSTPLPVAAELVTASGGGVLVPFHDTEQVVGQLLAWAQDPGRAVELGARGHAYAREHLDWEVHGRQFVAQLEELL